MKFTNSSWVSVVACCLLSGFFLGCAAKQEKSPAEKPRVEKIDGQSVNTSTTSATNSPNVPPMSSALPAGPATPNPYYQVQPKVPEAAQVQFQAAVAAIEQKNWNSAEANLKAVAAAFPNLSGVWLNLGVVYHNKNAPADALDALKQAIKVNSLNVDAYSLLALVEREQGDFNSAQQHLEKSVSVWPFYAEGHKNLAILFDLYLNQPEKALPHYLAYQQLLKERNLPAEAKQAETKQTDSWVAEVQRRLNGGKKPEANKAQGETPSGTEAVAQ